MAGTPGSSPFFVNEVGFDPVETLKCATLNGAKIISSDDETGSLEVGKIGDVVVVEGDVVADISVLEHRKNIRRVLQSGVTKAGTESTVEITPIPLLQ